MKVLNLFSKRQHQLRGETPDLFLYDKLPQELRIQLVHIFKDYLGDEDDAQNRQYMVGGAYDFIVSTLCREYGMFTLSHSSSRRARSHASEFFDFILAESDIERVLDAVELACRILDVHARKFDYRYRRDGDAQADAALGKVCKTPGHPDYRMA